MPLSEFFVDTKYKIKLPKKTQKIEFAIFLFRFGWHNAAYYRLA